MIQHSVLDCPFPLLNDRFNLQVSLRPLAAASFLPHVESLRGSDGFAREFRALSDWERKRMDMLREELSTGKGNSKASCKDGECANLLACECRNVLP